MKRYRPLKFAIDTLRNFLNYPSEHPEIKKITENTEHFLQERFGSLEFDKKLARYKALKKPILTVVGEYSHLLGDIENAYATGSLFAALTGACCLGERIFNDVILKVKEDFKSSSWYKKIYKKDGFYDWKEAIEILVDWKIFDEPIRKSYQRLSELRNESVHYQQKDQDLEVMSLEAINLVNSIIEGLFSLIRKDILLLWEVPGETYIKKEAEQLPLVKAFYLPASRYVGYKHTMVNDPSTGRWLIKDDYEYEDREITDRDFVELRKQHTNR